MGTSKKRKKKVNNKKKKFPIGKINLLNKNDKEDLLNFKEKIIEESEGILNNTLQLIEKLESEDKEIINIKRNEIKEKVNTSYNINNDNIVYFRVRIKNLFDEIREISVKYLNDRNNLLEIDSENTLDIYRTNIFNIVKSSALKNSNILQHMYIITSSYLNTFSYNANLICNYYMKNLSSDVFDNILYIIKLYLVKLIEYHKEDDSDLTDSIIRLLELLEDEMLNYDEIEKLFNIIEERDNIINISNEYNDNKDILLKRKPQKEPVWTYKELNNMALEQGYTLSRYNGDHAIFTKEGFASIPIPQKSLGKGIGIAIKKLIYSQKKIL
ncbi:hypothetical protein [Clostridium thermobutyricum]|uniref:hypothetical protein n=1 Tax=Clostridium thermobutyricum TaxID=29372 RepID=UPI0018A95DBB|nr:hypothetical protein [Clostridium thermobutyricum]